MRIIGIAVAAILIGGALSGCATASAPSNLARGSLSPSTVRPVWSCEYVPTMDHNWHNDVICRNGSRSVRPYLRKGDSHVTYDEIMAAAHRYEKRLNK